MGASSRSGEGIAVVMESAGSEDGSILPSKCFMLLEYTQKIEIRTGSVRGEIARTTGGVKSVLPPSQVATKPLGETVGCGNTAKVDGTTPLAKALGGSRLIGEPDGHNPSIMWQSAAEHLSALLRSLLVPVQRSQGCRSQMRDYSSRCGLRYDPISRETVEII